MITALVCVLGILAVTASFREKWWTYEDWLLTYLSVAALIFFALIALLAFVATVGWSADSLG